MCAGEPVDLISDDDEIGQQPVLMEEKPAKRQRVSLHRSAVTRELLTSDLLGYSRIQTSTERVERRKVCFQPKCKCI